MRHVHHSIPGAAQDGLGTRMTPGTEGPLGPAGHHPLHLATGDHHQPALLLSSSSGHPSLLDCLVHAHRSVCDECVCVCVCEWCLMHTHHHHGDLHTRKSNHCHN